MAITGCIGLLSARWVSAAPARSSLIIIATMHGLHKNHPGYNYDQLYQLVRDLHPDFVGVEIRPEDMQSDDLYLQANYPPEMTALAKQYGSQAFGFDWLGADVAGRPIPTDWWSERSPIKRLEREQDRDPQYQDTAAIKALAEKQHDILAHATAASLNDGRYDALFRIPATRQFRGFTRSATAIYALKSSRRCAPTPGSASSLPWAPIIASP